MDTTDEPETPVIVPWEKTDEALEAAADLMPVCGSVPGGYETARQAALDVDSQEGDL